MLRPHVPVLTAALVLFAACDPPPAPGAAIDAAALNVLLQRLDRVATAFEGAQRAAPATAASAHDAPAERTAVAGDSASLQARIDALEAELAVLRARAGGVPTPRASAFGTAPAMHVTSVQGLKEVRARDEAQSTHEALRSVFLLGPAQILERFGTPSYVSLSQSGACRWHYEEGEHGISITFAQGVVVKVD